MNGIVTAAEKKQSTGVHKHPMRPVPSPRMGLQTLHGVRSRMETSRGDPEKGQRLNPEGKTGQVGLSSTHTLSREQLDGRNCVLPISVS